MVFVETAVSMGIHFYKKALRALFDLNRKVVDRDLLTKQGGVYADGAP
jgi:hypothetical protein